MFTMLTPYLIPAYQCIDTSIDNPNSMQDFFDKDEYLSTIRDNCDELQMHKSIKFAEALIASPCFAHFMDGYLVDDVMNFDQVNSILCFRKSLNRRYKSPAVSLSALEKKIEAELGELSET